MKWMKKEKIRLNFLQRFIFFYAVIGFLPLLNGLLYSGMSKINSTYFDDHLTLIRLGPMIFFYVTLPVFYLINQMDYKPNYFNPDVWDKRIKTFKLIMSVIVWVFIYRSMVVFFFGIEEIVFFQLVMQLAESFKNRQTARQIAVFEFDQSGLQHQIMGRTA